MNRADAVERRLRGLDAAACGALVADLWAARGFETRHAGDVVVATRRGESQVVYPLPRARIGSPPRPDRAVDVVVDPRGRRIAREIAADHGARVVDAAGLRETLQYGVDREAAAGICERHLGARPEDLRPPLPARVRERVAAASSVGTAALVGLLAVLVVGGLVVGTSGLTAVPSGADGSADVPTRPAAGPAEGSGAEDAAEARTPTARPSWPTGPEAVPGLDENGVRDLFVLAAAHERAVWNRSYTLWVDYYGASERGSNATRTHRDTDVAVDGRRYLAVTSVGAPGGADEGDREVVRVVYHDGADRYVASSLGRNASHRRAESGGLPVDPTDPMAVRHSLVHRYLSTPETEVNGSVTRDGRTYYRLVGHGPPTAFDRRAVRNYTVVALVGPEGFVVDLTATYTVDVGRNVSVRREWTYGRVGSTSVDPPAWYEPRVGD